MQPSWRRRFLIWQVNRANRLILVVLRNMSGNGSSQDTESGAPRYVTAYPDDADGAVLADLAAEGVDMTKALTIEFFVAVPNEASAEKAAATMGDAGYESQIVYDEGEPDFDPETDDNNEFGPSWTVYTNVHMIPEYNEVMRIQCELDQITRPFGGKSDGWGVMFGGDAKE